MIKAKQLVQEYCLQIGRFSYAQMDCIGSIAGIIQKHGGKYDLMGSNWWARHEIKNLRPLTSKAQLFDGCAVLKTLHPGEAGYNLPDRYQDDAVQIDYNHIGLGTSDGEILDSTTQMSGGTYVRNGPGVSTAPINERILNSELTWWRGLILHENLDNRMSAKPSVQKPHNTGRTKGCLVSLVFNKTANPQVRLDIADMLLAAFEKRRRIDS